MTPPGARVNRLDTLALDVSSSEIRARLAAGEAPSVLPEAVLAYIRERRLYSEPRMWRKYSCLPRRYSYRRLGLENVGRIKCLPALNNLDRPDGKNVP